MPCDQIVALERRTTMCHQVARPMERINVALQFGSCSRDEASAVPQPRQKGDVVVVIVRACARRHANETLR